MKVAIVGSNRGIGLELTKKFIAEGHDVFAFCRTSSEELKAAAPTKITSAFEVTSSETMTSSLKELNESDFDLLVHVSGVLKSDSITNFNEDDVMKQFKINSIGPILSAKAFKPFLSQTSKIALMTSRMGSVADNGSGGMYGYRMSKAALNMAGKSLAQDYKNDGVTVLLLHPGFVQTDMTGNMGNITPKESAEQLYEIMNSKNSEQTGTFWHANGEELPW